MTHIIFNQFVGGHDRQSHVVHAILASLLITPLPRRLCVDVKIKGGILGVREDMKHYWETCYSDFNSIFLNNACSLMRSDKYWLSP